MQRVHDDVAKYGWHVIGVTGVGAAPEFAFTIGLYETHAHPELVVFGLPFKAAHAFLSTCVERFKQGASFEAGQVRTDLLNNHHVAISKIDRALYSDYLGSAIGFYGDTEFPALQLVWPDRANRFPWEPAFDPAYKGSQIILNATTS